MGGQIIPPSATCEDSFPSSKAGSDGNRQGWDT